MDPVKREFLINNVLVNFINVSLVVTVVIE